ncbi:MAG: hypothetical protein ACI8WP_000347 [Flavobacteriaceae bacterium]
MKKVFIILILVVFFGCTPEEIRLSNTSSNVVVEGWLTDSLEYQEVVITKTEPFQSTLLHLTIKNAQVSIKNNLNQTYVMTHVKDGLYRTNKKVRAIRNVYYQLTIRLVDGVVINSSFESPLAKSRIDSLYTGSITRESTDGTREEEVVFYPIISGVDSLNFENFYRFKISKNDTLFSQTSQINLLNDQFFDGNKFSNEFTEYEYLPGDVITIEQWQISRYAFEYLKLLKSQTTALGSVASTSPAQYQSNLNYENQSSEIVLGYWGVISKDSRSLVIP